MRSLEGLNPKYTFDSFVIGSSNRFAHAAALAVAEAPAQAYNPLFIYGGTGLGKTHLLQAIAAYVTEHTGDLTARYVTSETFMNDFINSLADKARREVAGVLGDVRRDRLEEVSSPRGPCRRDPEGVVGLRRRFRHGESQPRARISWGADHEGVEGATSVQAFQGSAWRQRGRPEIAAGGGAPCAADGLVRGDADYPLPHGCTVPRTESPQTGLRKWPSIQSRVEVIGNGAERTPPRPAHQALQCQNQVV